MTFGHHRQHFRRRSLGGTPARGPRVVTPQVALPFDIGNRKVIGFDDPHVKARPGQPRVTIAIQAPPLAVRPQGGYGLDRPPADHATGAVLACPVVLARQRHGTSGSDIVNAAAPRHRVVCPAGHRIAGPARVDEVIRWQHHGSIPRVSKGKGQRRVVFGPQWFVRHHHHLRAMLRARFDIGGITIAARSVYLEPEGGSMFKPYL